ncbi:hypothetical protein AB5I41_01495 [Sphingomonas sp. MMS24-JH45]
MDTPYPGGAERRQAAPFGKAQRTDRLQGRGVPWLPLHHQSLSRSSGERPGGRGRAAGLFGPLHSGRDSRNTIIRDVEAIGAGDEPYGAAVKLDSTASDVLIERVTAR